jgi:hypothetical protein
MKENVARHPSALHSPAAAQVPQFAAQAEQAPETITYPVAQVVQAAAEQAVQLAVQAAQTPESLANIASQVVQAVAEQVAQLDPQAVQAASTNTNLAKQVVHVSLAVQTEQLALQASQAEVELTK